MTKNIPTPEDLLEVLCPNCTSEIKRFGSRKVLNFKCENPECSRFYSDEVLREHRLNYCNK